MPRRSAEPASSDAPPKVRVNRESLRQLLSLYIYLRPYQSRLGLGIVLLICASILGVLFPTFVKALIDSPTHAQAFHTALLIVSVLLAQAVMSYFASMQFNRGGEFGLADLRKSLFAHLTEMPMSFYSKRQVGELTSRIFADLAQLQDTFVFAVPQLIRQFIILVGSIGLITYISPRLTGVMLICFPPTIIGAILIGRMVGSRSRQAQDELAQTATVVEEALQGIANIKAFVSEAYEQHRYASRIDVYLQAVLRGAKARATLVAFIIFAIFTAITIVLCYGSILLIDHRLTQGELFSFAFYTVFVGGSLGSFADLYSNLQRSLGATQRVREILADPAEVLGPLLPASGGDPFRGEVRFDQVTFAYPARPEVDVLKDLSFAIEPGQVVALVGASGAGKSTVAALLLRLYEPQAGRLFFDGRPASTYTLRESRRHLALVPQDVLLFGGSIAENIAYGRPGASQAEIESAARRANAHEFINGFPEGYATLVGDRGVKVSGGQRQRIAIARALLKDPAILILDEATSALDAESESLVQQALDELMKSRTCLVIAHRLSTIRRADRILVLRDGEIVESGTHDELMQSAESSYRRLVHLQSGSPETIAESPLVLA